MGNDKKGSDGKKRLPCDSNHRELGLNVRLTNDHRAEFWRVPLVDRKERRGLLEITSTPAPRWPHE